MLLVFLISPNERNFRNLGGNCQLHVSMPFLLIWPDLIHTSVSRRAFMWAPSKIGVGHVGFHDMVHGMRHNPKQGNYKVQLGNCPQFLQSMDLRQNPTNFATQDMRKSADNTRKSEENMRKSAERPTNTYLELACGLGRHQACYVALMNSW